MPQHILDLLARLREPGDNPLNRTELTELVAGLRGRAAEIRNADGGLTEESVTELRDLATAVQQAGEATTAIDTAQQQLEADAAAALEQIGEDETPAADGDAAAPDGDGAPAEDGTTDGGPQPTDTPEPPPATETSATPPAAPAPPAAVDTPAPATATAEPAVPEAVAASARPVRPTPGQAATRLAPAQRPASRPTPVAPAAPARSAHSVLVAAGGPTDVPSGTTFETMTEVANATLTAHRRMGSPGRAMIASLVTEYPEELHLRRGQDEENSRKIEAALTEALVASGGICGPVAVDYTLPSWATTDRPIKGGLPSFQADRGGLTFVRPSALSTWSDATEIWTEATDANPGTATKPVHVVTCGTTDTVYVDAIPTRLRFGNMQGRYFPEQVAYNTTQALAVAARDAETNLWDKIIGYSTVASAPQYLGAARDLLAYVDLAAAAQRDRGRMSDGQRIRMLIHRTYKHMLKTDLAREIGHAQNADFNSLAVTDEDLAGWLDARGVTPIWALDSPTPVTKSGQAIPYQGFADQSAGAVLSDWPARAAFTMWPEGGFQFLDGGRLDLGVVRDSVLDATNDYETFIEPYESVAFRAVEATTVVVPLAPTGGSAGTIAPAEPTE